MKGFWIFEMSLCLSSVCLVGLEGVLRNGEYVGHVRRADHAFYLEQVR